MDLSDDIVIDLNLIRKSKQAPTKSLLFGENELFNGQYQLFFYILFCIWSRRIFNQVLQLSVSENNFELIMSNVF
jgi:hypothetical protein